MEKAVDDFRKELATLRTGRANASVLDSIRRGLSRNAHARESAGYGSGAGGDAAGDFPLGSQRRAADRQSHRASDLGLNPTNDGKVVRIPMPSPTEERRKES